MSCAKGWLFCLGLNVLMIWWYLISFSSTFRMQPRRFGVLALCSEEPLVKKIMLWYFIIVRNIQNFFRNFLFKFRCPWRVKSYHFELFFFNLDYMVQPLTCYCIIHWHCPNRLISQTPQCTCLISHNVPLRKEMCTFLFWIVHWGMWDKCMVGLMTLVNSSHMKGRNFLQLPCQYICTVHCSWWWAGGGGVRKLGPISI